jgi:hypothetical protein
LLSLGTARERSAVKWHAPNKAGARLLVSFGVHEKAEGGGKRATEKKTSKKTGRKRNRRMGIRQFDRQRHRAQDRVHVLDLVIRTAEPPPGSWR